MIVFQQLPSPKSLDTLFRVLIIVFNLGNPLALMGRATIYIDLNAKNPWCLTLKLKPGVIPPPLPFSTPRIFSPRTSWRGGVILPRGAHMKNLYEGGGKDGRIRGSGQYPAERGGPRHTATIQQLSFYRGASLTLGLFLPLEKPYFSYNESLRNFVRLS
jgi:hypothetical protein